MSLRWFHMVFLLIAMVAADMFGGWAMWYHGRSGGDVLVLVLGIVSLIGGLALAGYVAWLVQKLDVAKVQ